MKKIEFPKENYLFDSDGEFVSFQKIKSIYTTLANDGYVSTSFRYDDKVYVSKKELISNFIPVVNSSTLTYKNKSFETVYGYWYNKQDDFYLLIYGSGQGLSYFDEDEEIEEDQEKIRISNVLFKIENIGKVQSVMNSILIKEVSNKNKIDIIIQTQQGFDFVEHNIKPLPIDIDTMYNDDFKEVHEHIVDKLNNADKGIVLLHGHYGTGKSNYLKNLTQLVQRRFVFVPINMIGHISSPTFIGDLVQNKGSILVIEDCEQYIQDRKTSETSIVSPLLQLTDGFLSDITDVKIIATFNNDSASVDPALKRNGRLIAEYEFKKLEAYKVQELTQGKYSKEMTLAEIFDDLTYSENQKEEKTIGFGR